MLIRNLKFFYSKAYQILGVNINAGIDQVKTAYYTKAQLCHPDRNKQSNAHQKFSQLNNAYKKILQKLTQTESSEPFQNQNTMNNKKTKKKQQNQGNQYSYDQSFQYVYNEYVRNFKNKKKQKVNNKFSKAANQKKSKFDVVVKLILTPQQRTEGCIKQITFKKLFYCNCQPKRQNNLCNVCRGQGFVIGILKGMGTVHQLCEKCGGSGIRKHQCKKCRGKGMYQKQCTQKITIPPGVIQNSTIKLEERKKQPKQHTGDIYIRIFEKKNHKKSKEKNKQENIEYDVHSELTINCIEAILGCTKTIDTLFGKKQIKIDRGTHQDQIIILKGYGYEMEEKNEIGNHYVKIKIHIPKTLSEQQQILYKKLQQLQNKSFTSDQS